MSRPFPDTFEDERSPLTPLSGGPSQSISYQANVNRRKTKKWADAKPVSYGGDDWGDEYDDEYDAAPPQPEVPKPTGFRQPGQGVGALQQPAGNYNDGRKPYGDLQGPSMAADRSATQPQQLRRNSFGNDDERRAFSSGPTQFLQQGQEAPQLHVQTQPQLRNAGGLSEPGPPPPTATPPIQAPGGFPETPYSIAESQRGYMDQPHQPYQPYQQPNQPASPVNARGTPIQPGYGRNASPMSAGRPPRKSSLSQSSIPDASSYQSHSRERSQEPKMKPWPGPGVLSSPENSAPQTSKALPFVRPADIYMRLEEERTKERQSMESGRPSMDSIMRDREMSPAATQPSSTIAQSQDQYTRGRSGSQSEYTDSGRRLGQSLEPVAERKSEYSFMDASTRSPEVAQKLDQIKRADTESPYKPYRKQSPEDAPEISFNDNSQISEQDSSFEEKRRRFSTSPKLPDLNRMSGFGFDMWGAPPDEPELEPARPVVALVQPVTKAEEPPALKKEPSLGFNSVVHQAFDRNDSFSDARDPSRTGSEDSVGTTGISPIISKDAFIADASTPMITEEKEPDSRVGSGRATPKQENRPATPSLQFGHRRDLSAPISVNSRDASPARQPAIMTPAVIGPGVQVHVSEESEMSPASAEEEQKIEDQARYERYPRPPIPGGWTSYATTGGESVRGSEESNVNAPSDTSKIAPFTADIIASNPLPDEFSPTIAARTEEMRPPSPEPVAVIQSKAADDHSPSSASEMDNLRISSPSTEHAPKTTAPDELSSSLVKEADVVALPTPDPHMGPVGNPYSIAPVDPRIDGGHSQSQPETPLSKKSADTITGLAPPTIHEPGVSPGSNVGPTPPPKDTPRMPGSDGNDYFPPPVPLKRRTAEEVAAAEGLAPPQRPAMMPTLSTNTSAYDDENDKLRKEIVKSLSPRQSLSGPSSGPAQSSNLGQSMLAVSSPDAPRESMYLPSEYDSYWGATDDEPSAYTVHSQTQEIVQSPITPQNDVKFNITAASPGSEDAATPPIPPLNPKRISRTSMGSIPGITNDGRRYSFDQGNERVSREQSSRSTPALAPVDASPPGQDRTSKPWSPENGSAKGKLPVDLQRADSASPAPLSIRSAKTDKISDLSSQKPKEETTGQTEGILGTMAAVGAVVAATVLPIGGPSANADDDAPEVVGKDVLELDGVVVDEDDHINDKSLSAEVSPISAASQQDIPPMMNVVPPPSETHGQQPSMPQLGMAPSPLNISRPTTAASHNQIFRPPQNQAPPMEFRQIMVMPSPEQRIEAYNKTRLQYAQMESGLADWLVVTTNTPITPPHGQDTGRSRAGSVAQGGPAPYYQQYINASSAATPVGGNMGTPQRQSTLGTMGLGTQSSFSSGGRSQQQAQQAAQQAKEKGKELLHSAGIFGGAVGKKGKGLFKKGTSRWLGGGDKESDDTRDAAPPAPSKPEGYTPSVRSASFSTYATPRPSMNMGGPGSQRQVSGEYPVFAPQARDQSPSPRGPMPSMTPTESSKPTPSKRRTSWLKNLGNHHKDASGRPPSRSKQDSYEGKIPPRRVFSHDVSSLLHLRRPSTDQQQGQQQQFRPPFGHQHSASFHASPQNSSGPQYASPQDSFGPSDQRPQYGSPVGSYGRQRSGSLPLPPGVTIDAREVSSVASNTPLSLAQPMAPQIQLDLPPPTLIKDEHWLSASPTHSGSPHTSGISSQIDSGSPHPSQNTSRHPSGVPSVAQSMTSEQRLENEETRDNFDVDKPLPSLEAVQDDHEHTGVKPPVPIGKYQPSWDPFNATPIAEEREGSEYSFGAGKISPPKLSPSNLDTVDESEAKIDSTQSPNPVLAGAARIMLPPEARTTTVTTADNVREAQEHKEQPQSDSSQTIVETRELDEDDIYNASPPPPPKSSRRSLSISRDQLKPAPQLQLGPAAGTMTTVGAIKDQGQTLSSDDTPPQRTQDEEWELVEHKDTLPAAVLNDDLSYFLPTTPPTQKKEYAPTPPVNARLDPGGQSRNQARGHSRGISEVSAVSTMSIGTMSPGEVVNASQVTVEQTSPSSVKLRDSLQSVVSKQSREQEQDFEEGAPPKPAFMATRGSEEEQRTPTMESVPGWFPGTPGVSEAPSSLRAASVKEDGLTPRQEQPIISPLSPAQPHFGGHTEQQHGFEKPTHGVQPLFAQTAASRTFSIEDDGQPLSKAEMVPEAVQRAQDNVSDLSDEEDESPYHETLGIIRGLGIEAQRTGREVELQNGIVQSREPMTSQREADTRAKLEKTLSGTAMRLGQPQPGKIMAEAEAVRASNAAIEQPVHVGKHEFSPDDEEDYDQELYLPDWEKAELNQRRKVWKAEHPGEKVPYYVLHPRYSKGIVVSEEPQTRQREPEAERLWAANAGVVGQPGKGNEVQKYAFSSENDDDKEPNPPELRQLETEKLQDFKGRHQKIKDEIARQEALLSQVYNKGSTISEEPVSRQRDEAEKMRALKAQAVQQSTKNGPTMEEELRRRKAEGGWLQQGITQSREPQNLQRAFSERMKVESEQVLRHGGRYSEMSKQQVGEAETSGNYSRAEALKRDVVNVWTNETKGATLSREHADRRLVMGEGENMRIANAQSVEQQQGEAQAPYFAAMAPAPRPEHQAQSMGPGATMSREPHCRQRKPEGAKQSVYGGAARPLESEVHQGAFDADIARDPNAKVVRTLYDGDTVEEELLWRKGGGLAQHGMTISREPEARQADFQESKSMHLHDEQNIFKTRTDEGAERMRKANARKLWTQQDQVDFDHVHGAGNAHEHITFEQPTRSFVPTELAQAAAIKQPVEYSLAPVELQSPKNLGTEDLSSLSDEDHDFPRMDPPGSLTTSSEPDYRQREPIPRRDSVELARARSLSRARRVAHGDDEEEDNSRPHVVHFSTEEEKKKAAGDAWLAGVKIEEEKMRRQEAERAAAIARNSQAGGNDSVKLGIAQSREPPSKQMEPDVKQKSWAQEIFSHIPLLGDKLGAPAVSKTTNADQNTPEETQYFHHQGGPAPTQQQVQPQPTRGIQVPLGLQQMARDKSSMSMGLEPAGRDLDRSPPPRSPAHASRVLSPSELTRPMAETEEHQLVPTEFRHGILPPSGLEQGGEMLKSRENSNHDGRNISSAQQQQSPLPPSEPQRLGDTVQPRSIVPIEIEQAAQQHSRTTSSSPLLPSLSVPKHRTSPSKDLISEEQRNAESPSTSTASGSGFAIPPIRRTSTFGFGVVTKAKPGKDRFSIEDDEGDYMADNQSPHIVSPMSTTSINYNNLPLPVAPKLHREEAVANSPDLRQRAGSIGTLPRGLTQPEVPANVQERKESTFVPVSSSLRRTSNVPRRASQEVREARANRFSFQREGSEPVQEVLSRPPITHQSSSDYNQPWTGQSTPTPLKSERPNYMVESASRVVSADANMAALGVAMIHEQENQQQQAPPQQQLQPYENISQARGGSAAAQSRQFVFETQQQQQLGPPITVNQFAGQDLQQSSAPRGPQRPSMDAPHQKILSIDSQRMMQQRGPSLGGVGTVPAQPPKIVPQYNETVARPLSYTRSGARDGPPGIPPSSAERYPELFQSAQPADSPASPMRDGDGRQGRERKGDIPGDYAVAEKGHLPRQQATEYALPGVGPPADYPRNGNGGRSSRRNSGFLKEIGGRLSRDSSRHRERRSSVDRRADERQRASMVEPNEDNLVISRVEDRRSVLENRDSDDDMSIDVDEKTQAFKKDKPRRRSLLDVFGQKSTEGRSEQGQQPQHQQIEHRQSQQHRPMYGRPPSQVESMITHRPDSRANLLSSLPPSTGPHSQPQQYSRAQTNPKEEKSKKKWSFFGKKKEKENQFEEKRENAGVILASAGSSAADNQRYNVGVVQSPGQPPQQTFVPQQQQQMGQQVFNPRDPRFTEQQQQPRQQLTGGPQRLSAPVPQPIRHFSTALASHEPARPAQLPPTSTSGSLPAVAQIPDAFARNDASQASQAQTSVIAPELGRGPVPSEFTPHTGTPSPKSPLSSNRMQPPLMQQQQRLPAPQMQPQNQTAYLASQPQIAGPSYSQQIQQSQAPHGQHQAYAQKLAQDPLSLKKTNSNADRHVLQKRPSSAASSQKGKEVKEKKKSFLSEFLGKRGTEKDKKVGLVAALGAAGVAAQHQQQHQHQGQHQMSGTIPPHGQQQLGGRDPSVQQWQQQQQMLQGGRQKQLQGGPQAEPQQLYESPSIPGPYTYVRGDGQLGPVNRGPMILTPHQQMALHQNQQPVFADQRSYDEYVRQHQALQARQQGIYASLPPPPPQGYNAPRQEQVPTQFRRASLEYVRDLNARSSQEYARHDSIGGRCNYNPVAGGQQLNPTYTQGLAAQNRTSQKQEPIPVAIPVWKRATRDTPNITTPPSAADASPPPIIGPHGDFPHLTAYNPNANKTPDTPQPQAKGSKSFLGLNDGRKMSNLSTEDLLARSPARAQFGQQAPYQLSLPGGDDDDDYDDIPSERRSPPKDTVPDIAAGVAGVALAGTTIAGHRNSRERSPLSRQFPPHQQQQASNVPVPETAFSPIVDRGDGLAGGEMPPPPIPKWSSPPTPTGGVHQTQLGQHQAGVRLLHPGGQVYQPGQQLSSNDNAGVGRSNTVMSDVSSMTVESPHQTPSPHQPAGLAPSTAVGYNHPPQHQHKKSIPATTPDVGDRLSQVQSHSSGVSVSPRSTPNNTPVVQQAQSVVTHQRPVVSQSRTEQVVQRIRIPSDIRSPPLPVQQPIQGQPSEQIEMSMPPPMPTARAPSPPIAYQAVPANATGGFVIQDDRAPADRPTVLTQNPDHSGLIYDNSREGLIVVEDANVRRVNQGQTTEEDEGPVMSATSFPGDEWRPFGWDEGGYD